MSNMGRPKSALNRNLPPRMVARRYPSGAVAYYYAAGKKRIPLGRDLAHAKRKWAEFDGGPALTGTFAAVAAVWKEKELAKRGVYTQKQYAKYLLELVPAFGPAPLDAIGTVHCQQYLERRSAKVKANREIALLSTIFNWARRTGRTTAPNPVPGLQKNPEVPRGRYVTEEEFNTAYLAAAPWPWRGRRC